MTVNPSFSSSCAYCTVSMFWAALETLYAGVGVRALKCAQPMDPSAEELRNVSVLLRGRKDGFGESL